jgi:AcrR family transcriptional regulator
MVTEKKQQILDTALLLFVEQGIQATATAKIAKQANVATGTLFHHFSNKQELVVTLYRSIKDELSQSISQNTADNVGSSDNQADALKSTIESYWHQAIEWAMSHPLKWQFLQQFANDPQFKISQQQDVMTSSMAFLVEAIEQGQQQGILAPLPIPLVLNYCHYHYLAVTTLFIEQPELFQQPSYQDGAFQMFWQGLVTKP